MVASNKPCRIIKSKQSEPVSTNYPSIAIKALAVAATVFADSDKANLKRKIGELKTEVRQQRQYQADLLQEQGRSEKELRYATNFYLKRSRTHMRDVYSKLQEGASNGLTLSRDAVQELMIATICACDDLDDFIGDSDELT